MTFVDALLADDIFTNNITVSLLTSKFVYDGNEYDYVTVDVEVA